MYLEPANNNKASTGFSFFLTACERNGLPSKYVQVVLYSYVHHDAVLYQHCDKINFYKNLFTYQGQRWSRCGEGRHCPFNVYCSSNWPSQFHFWEKRPQLLLLHSPLCPSKQIIQGTNIWDRAWLQPCSRICFLAVLQLNAYAQKMICSHSRVVKLQLWLIELNWIEFQNNHFS